MRAGKTNRLVLVSCKNLREARRLARAAVVGKLAACANISLQPVESLYAWKGKVEIAREYLLTLKTTTRNLARLEREVQRLHSYEVPEFILVPIVAGSAEYLAWMESSVGRTTH